ncbi:two-component system phosphate regulon sensor histidine kinase PhoR [Thermoflavifilum aggregans]|uniref:histidine kinase n=1 Tax=Thermoflavifilum aggregans TaxID=454188 RepID=A0A2M9CT81_9BACT|nr:ATP-binding protein [Thermoflavifilum aggregans]PJJ75103.1 two-component system phosphate regulon sensor histidine kinase PhoR [Thermoflavifilum aggregans]
MLFNDKNLSTGKLSFFSAIIIGIVAMLAGALMHLHILQLLWLSLVTWAAALAIIRYVMERFLYRKIKLIYKLIYQTKATPQEEFFQSHVLPKPTLEEVQHDVELWASQQRNELEVLRKNEKFRKEFLMNLSHELKTPIFAIQGYIHTLLDGAIEDSEVNRTFLKNAAKNIDRLCRLIDDVDEISRLESGEIQLNKEAFVIQDLIKDVFDLLSLKASQKNIQFYLKKGCETPVTVYADKERIREVLINLIDNSIKYGKQDGHTFASVYNTDEQHVLIEISDDGIGIAEEHLTRVFERFYRTDKARSRDAGGTGLGLAIVKHIIEAHGQTIHVRSKPDIGSTFGFTLELFRE